MTDLFKRRFHRSGTYDNKLHSCDFFYIPAGRSKGRGKDAVDDANDDDDDGLCDKCE